ncbi:hypothetical protein BABINDRAFT_160752 [Babjeviella inositovora NRRL Y-12698]|uniref:Deacetylase sirtuin-type domain-containing protein n=1 Tax=Babjeviella inositovora NRRL Y-12698 TaxID=984486 RepID=A0A1E3QTZ3_9ASCO|nr:uncharacterized protein BABINDRAFT_160752 [Babjeviella inositovora NRRL Y-12698]ODQ80472.1 hypothetical protein BABINDRAFT_160752 [Babjeviella inositovora NRRL Y-12698]
MKLLDIHSLDAENKIRLSEVTSLISKARKCVVLTGAGISCNAGIPDFRSTDGLYNMVKEKHPKAVVRGKDLFDISLFRNQQTVSIFNTFMESLYSSTLKARPTDTHRFIKVLKQKKKLLRCYTQNIDGLENYLNLNTGIPEDSTAANWKKMDVVQLHGDLMKLSCTNCFNIHSWDEVSVAAETQGATFRELLSDGRSPECPTCVESYRERIRMGKRMTGAIGFLRPNIVLYGENHMNSEVISQGLTNDLKSSPDLFIIMGTSLKVDGIKKLVRSVAKVIQKRNEAQAKPCKVILINKTPLPNTWANIIDYQINNDCDAYMLYLRNSLPDLFLTQQELDLLKTYASVTKRPAMLTPPTTPTKRQKYSDIHLGEAVPA